MSLNKSTSQSRTESIDVSVVIPVYNEEENVKILHNNINQVLKNSVQQYEIIFIDDGSNDRTFENLNDICEEYLQVKIIKFRKNFGQSAATAAGFDFATGKVVITMDGDLQNDPNDIPKLLRKLEEGYDVVSGWRKNRKDKLFIRKIPSRIANKIICKVTNVKLHDTGCALKAYRADIIQRLNLYGEMHRFLPALASIEGARITELEVNHHPRIHGKSKYNLSRTYKVIMDLISLNLFIRYLRYPLYFFGRLAVIFNMLAVLMLGGMLFLEFSNNITVAEFNNLMTVIFLLFATGFQLLLIGLLGYIIVKTGQKREFYLVEKKV